MRARPLHPHAALLLEGDDDGDNGDEGRKKRYVAVSDLHIGMEAELGARGITVRSSLTGEMLDGLVSMVRSAGAQGLVLLGDVKNTVKAISRQEWDDVPAFFEKLAQHADVYLVPGNHDANIARLVPASVNISASRGMVIGDTLFVHGHSMPSEARSHVRRIVMGHLHPVFLKKGSVLAGERVWVYLQVKKDVLFASAAGGELVEVIVVPSFNKYLHAGGPEGVEEEGARRGARPYKKSTSPIISRVLEKGAVEKCIIATLDGSVVGDDVSALPLAL